MRRLHNVSTSSSGSRPWAPAPCFETDGYHRHKKWENDFTSRRLEQLTTGVMCWLKSTQSRWREKLSDFPLRHRRWPASWRGAGRRPLRWCHSCCLWRAGENDCCKRSLQDFGLDRASLAEDNSWFWFNQRGIVNDIFHFISLIRCSHRKRRTNGAWRKYSGRSRIRCCTDQTAFKWSRNGSYWPGAMQTSPLPGTVNNSNTYI